MKLKFILTFFAIALLASCSKDDNEIETTDSVDFQNQTMSVNFDAEAAYYGLLESDNMIEDLQDYSYVQQSAIWGFKYQRFLNDNDGELSEVQEDMVNSLIEFTSVPELFESPNEFMEEVETIAIQTKNAFPEDDAKRATFLLGSLENNFFDIQVNPNTGEPSTEWCFWCNETTSEEPCVMDMSNGTTSMQITYQRFRFGIAWGNEDSATVGCSLGQWASGGYQTKE